MKRAPAAGERAALRGYRWQYDHIAALVYDALVGDDFESLRLVDPDAGKVDDLVLLRRGRVDGFQFKSSTGYVSIRQLSSTQRTRSGKLAPSLFHSLAQGWLRLRESWPAAEVHLASRQLASPNDHLNDRSERRVSGDSTSTFHREVLTPLRLGTLTITDVPHEWQETLDRLSGECGLSPEQFTPFLGALHLDLGLPPALPESPSTRRSDIIQLSSTLYRTVSEATGVVELNRGQLLSLMGWSERPLLRSSHDFPVDLDTYSPLDAALKELDAELESRLSGYVVILGPPGAGKSTLLAQGLSGRSDRIVRYYAHIPGYAPARTRMTGRSFLHDLVLMLRRASLDSGQPHLASADRDELRRELHEQLDAAGREFHTSGRRTILVIDGLDHVEREELGAEGLLGELPRPSELPDGVVIVVGSRTQNPLRPEARQQIEEEGGAVDLANHRLRPGAVLDICRRAPITTSLNVEVHERIAELSAGHPLAVSLLLNRLRDREVDEDAMAALAAAPTYKEDISREYRVVWDDIAGDHDVVEILGVCSRLRVGFTTEWLATWATPRAVTTFRRNLLYLFRPHHDGWRFFHDSFREFTVHRTALDDAGRRDPNVDAVAHSRAAELCAHASDPRLAAEELFHRFHAGQGDAVLALADQGRFREQFRLFRSPELILTDIVLTLNVAGQRGGARHALAALFSAIELSERLNVLERIDLPAALLDAAMIAEAIAVCGGYVERLVPLAQAYRLAARLGREGRPEGRQIFDLVEHNGFDDPERGLVSGEEDLAAEAWGEAAPLFRPLAKILPKMTALLTDRDNDQPHDQFDRGRRRRRFGVVVSAVCGTLADQRRTADLLAVDVALHQAAQLLVGPMAGDEGQEARSGGLAMIVDLRVQLRVYLVEIVTDTAELQRHLDRAAELVRDAPAFYSTIFDVAELLIRYERTHDAAVIIQGVPLPEALTVSKLSYSGDRDVVRETFRHWRLRYVLADESDAVPDPAPPAAAAPAGDDVATTAAVHADREAIELSARIDRAIRVLAGLTASLQSETPKPNTDAWREMVPILDVFRPAADRSSATYGGIVQQRRPLMHLLVSIAVEFGGQLPDQLASALAARFKDLPDAWPIKLKLDLARQLENAGVAVEWYADTLTAAEAAAREGDVTGRVQEIAELVRVHADDGRIDEARRLALELVPMGFGVGYRKDDQFSQWVDWLGRALREESGSALADEAVWMARLLIAAEPMTEGAPGSAASRLPPALASVSPLAAVRLFEYLVRSGTVDHLDTLAALVAALVAQVVPGEGPAIHLAADLTAELIATAAGRAYPDTAAAIVTAAGQAGKAVADRLAQSIAARTDRYALPTTRASWRHGLGAPLDTADIAPRDEEPTDDYGALILDDARRIPRAEVAEQARDTASVLNLRSAESRESTFRWAPIVESLSPSVEEAKQLARAFDNGTPDGADVLVTLAERHLVAGNKDDARHLADRALRGAPDDAWSHWHRGATRRRAYAVAIAAGVDDALIDACRNLGDQLAPNKWFAATLTYELSRIIEALYPGTSAIDIWPELRTHLDGMAETLALPRGDVLDERPVRWWLSGADTEQRGRSSVDSPAAALAELAVSHLSHPTWVARDAATRVVVRALVAGNVEISDALARLATPDASDDILEAAGRCLAAARSTPDYAAPTCLVSLEHTLANHPSQVLRDLAETPTNIRRPLSSLYSLTLPPTPAQKIVGHAPLFLMPHDQQYKVLAHGLDLDENTVRSVAGKYASQLDNTLPEPADVRNALKAARMQHTYATPRIAAARGAFGRILADLLDAGLLDDIPPHIRQLLRTVDIKLLDQSPTRRPAVVPIPPPAGHDQTAKHWLDTIDERLAEYKANATAQAAWLVGATSQLTVLNWDHLEEKLVCGTVLRRYEATQEVEDLFQQTGAAWLSDLADTGERAVLSPGDPLILKNVGWTFHQLNADWIAFRPDVAASLGWQPDVTMPGRWLTAAGDLAVETIRWVDGWTGRAGPEFDDTEAEGHAVVATLAGLTDLTIQLGTLTRHFLLTRWGRDDGKETAPVHVMTSDSASPND